MITITERDEKRFWAKVRLPDESGCMNWTAYKDKNGYGRFRVKDDGRWVHRLPHRLSWLIAYGYEPDELDHLCKNPSCVRPDHLDDVGRAVNMKRTRRERCRKNHDAWYEVGGRRRCRTCVHEQDIKRGKRKP